MARVAHLATAFTHACVCSQRIIQATFGPVTQAMMSSQDVEFLQNGANCLRMFLSQVQCRQRGAFHV